MKAKEFLERFKTIDGESTVHVVDGRRVLLDVAGITASPPLVCIHVGEESDTDFAFPDIVRSVNEDVTTIFVCDNAFGDSEEHELVLTFRDGKAVGRGVEMSYPKTADLTREQIVEIDDYVGGRIFDSGCVTPYDVCLTFGKFVLYGIMDGTNGHDKDLVDKINVAWVTCNPTRFGSVLRALYERDIREIIDADSFQIDAWTSTPQFKKWKKTGDSSDYKSFVLGCMHASWQDYADNYLMHIADDEDLECILKFLRR